MTPTPPLARACFRLIPAAVLFPQSHGSWMLPESVSPRIQPISPAPSSFCSSLSRPGLGQWIVAVTSLHPTPLFLAALSVLFLSIGNFSTENFD